MARNFGNWTTISFILGNFLLRMRRNGQNSTSGKICNHKFEIVMAASYSNTNLVALPPRFWTYVFWTKNCFFGIWGLVRVGVKFFWWNPQKAHRWLILRVLRHWLCKSVQGFFFCRRAHKR